MAPLALPGVQQGIWPTVPFQPTPKEDKSEHEYNKAAAKMNLDYKKDCTWTKKPGKESMPAYPTFASDHVPGCFLHCFEARLKRHEQHVGFPAQPPRRCCECIWFRRVALDCSSLRTLLKST